MPFRSPAAVRPARCDPDGETPTRPCGCDWDILVFGHQGCWLTIDGWKHVVCRCGLCTCYCHKDG
jgi:hypothetical protein